MAWLVWLVPTGCTGGPRGQPDMAPQSPGRGHHKAPKSFFKSEFGPIPSQKNSGLNPWSFQIWGYARLGPPVTGCPPPPRWPSGSALVAHPDATDFPLTRALLGYFYNTPHWGGGYFDPPPLISKTTGPILKIQAAFESPGKTVEGKQILMTSGSPVTSQFRSKCMFDF